MLYRLIKIWLQIALKFYLKNLNSQGTSIKEISTPAILAVNHSNSFLDALLVTAHYPKEIHFLARGDAFNKKWASWILKNLLNIIPIHRLEEGREYLSKNTESFQEVMEVFKRGGTVLIFPEGICKNEHNIRPLRKGTARMAYQAWHKHGIKDLTVQAITLRYASFTKTPKDVTMHLAQPVNIRDFDIQREAVFYNEFNRVVKKKLEVENLNNFPIQSQAVFIKILLALPSFLGYLIHRPYYIFIKKLVSKKTKGTVFYDSVLFGLLMLTYPFFVLLITVIVFLISQNMLAWGLLILLPLLGWCYKKFKK